jgi:hypothetical protein
MICSGVRCFRFAVGCPPGVQGALSQPRWTRFRGAGQRLEDTLVQMLGLMARLDDHAVTPAELSSLELRAQKKTLGTLLREFRKRITAIEPVEDMLDTALDRRNFLTHHFFRERQEEIGTAEGVVRMVKELQEIGEQLAKANQIMTAVAKLMLKCIRQDAERLAGPEKAE